MCSEYPQWSCERSHKMFSFYKFEMPREYSHKSMKSCLYAKISSHWSYFLKHVISVTNFLQHILGHLVQKLDLGAHAILDHYPYVSK